MANHHMRTRCWLRTILYPLEWLERCATLIPEKTSRNEELRWRVALSRLVIAHCARDLMVSSTFLLSTCDIKTAEADA